MLFPIHSQSQIGAVSDSRAAPFKKENIFDAQIIGPKWGRAGGAGGAAGGGQVVCMLSVKSNNPRIILLSPAIFIV